MNPHNLIVIADPHLGSVEGDVQQMVDFIRSIDTHSTQLLFLGDLFHIWAGPQKYHTTKVMTLMKELSSFRKRGGVSYLIAGNRDVFLPEITNPAHTHPFPFSFISGEYCFIELAGSKIVAAHGDTINSKDLQYLKWRKVVRSWWFRAFFNLIPAFWVKKIMISLERKLKGTNMAFRKVFPDEEWQHFLKMIDQTFNPDLLIAGHFHPKDPIITNMKNFKGVVVPAWNPGGRYLEISTDLALSFKSIAP